MKNVTSLLLFVFIVLEVLAYHDVLPNYPLTWQPCIYFV